MTKIQEVVKTTEQLIGGELLAIALKRTQEEQKETWQTAAEEIPEYAKAIMGIQSLIAKTQEADPSLVNTYDIVWLEVEDAEATMLLTRILVGMNLNSMGALGSDFEPLKAKKTLVQKLGFVSDTDPQLKNLNTAWVIEKMLLMFAGEAE